MFSEKIIFNGNVTGSQGPASRVSNAIVILGGLISRHIWMDAVSEQPLESTTLTMYVPESVINMVSVVAPVLHLYALNFKLSVSVSTPPVSAMIIVEAVIVTIGFGLTITATVSELVTHPP